ncbi:uncharacterized protein ASPGLDRAFT_75047 [Aspergillus glaucus CBS 516.65]|uniref:O-methyltransferase C-terminal domain-containing protein n=1 Tax=Aspergillus glaucus CBS 516.65 TaxID=1160497 RepID=A0A1L9VGM3_ASPGL|nr:hypothetical protein ASPGLDRAFT_75047 [Aspergillus glaucus CBS 516.65]OJJ82982.1 hypothetical protein ASPGLDRAFT_75047 [Aspergillus glaucus CBS 516.65]
MEVDRGSRPSWLEWFPVKECVIDGFDCTISDTLLVDAAGGRGHDIQAFLKKFPEASGRLIVEDQPHVIEDIRDLDQSIERIGFDLFDKQPIKGARTYYLKFILHDWNDEDCRKIPHNIASQFILADTGCAMLPAMPDWEMMVFCNSMERTQGQWQRLLESAVFDMIRLWNPPGDRQGIIEADFEGRPREVSYQANV